MGGASSTLMMAICRGMLDMSADEVGWIVAALVAVSLGSSLLRRPSGFGVEADRPRLEQESDGTEGGHRAERSGMDDPSWYGHVLAFGFRGARKYVCCVRPRQQPLVKKPLTPFARCRIAG
jgi:hypothetical protein